MHVLIVRHGQCLGQCEPFDPSPDSLLSPLGEQQARLTARRLATYPWSMTEREHDEHVGLFGASRSVRKHNVHIISSPLVRALATATMISDELGDPMVEVWTELRELYTAKHRGLGRAELLQRFPQAQLPDACRADGWEHGDASYEAAFERAVLVISMLTKRFSPNEHVVLVTHGGFANVLAHVLLRIPLEMPSWFALENCAVSHVRLIPANKQYGWPPLFPPVATEIVCWNDISHLAELSTTGDKQRNA